LFNENDVRKIIKLELVHKHKENYTEQHRVPEREENGHHSGAESTAS